VAAFGRDALRNQGALRDVRRGNRRRVYGARDPKGGADGGAFDVLRSGRTNHQLEVVPGVLEEEAAAQLQRFFRERRAPREEGIEPAAP
jgi:hypothetical protein